MLHLAIIGIVCAVSAPSEGTAFIGRKNNESVFCHFEGEQNIAKVSLPSYNVDVFNSSDCAKQKITNRTSSFFYDYIIKQYQDSKNSSCSIIKNAFLEKEKKLHSNVEFTFRKRNLLWIQHNSRFLTKTLRPVMEDGNFKFKKPNGDEYKPKKCKGKIRTKAEGKLTELHSKFNLNPEQKRMFLRLKKIKRRPEKEKFYPKYLDRIKVVDELDLNKRIEKLVKEVALENQQREKYFSNDYAFVKSAEKDKISDSSQKNKIKDSFFNSIKKLFCFYKNFFKRKKRDVDNVVNSFSVNKVRSKDPIAEKMALISGSDFTKTKRKPTRFKRNSYRSFNYYSNPAPIRRQNFIETLYPYSANFKPKRCFLRPPGIRQVFPENGNSLENWPFFKKRIQDSRLKRYDMYTEKPIELPATKEEDSITMSNFKDTQDIKKSTDKRCVCSTESTSTQKSSTKKNEYGKTTEETILSSLTSSGDLKESTTVNLIDLNMIEKDKEDVFSDHTLEKPFLMRDLQNEKFEYYKPYPNFEAYEARNYNPVIHFPISDLNYFQPNLKYKYEVPDNKYLRPFRFLKIRHALRNYLVRNKVWSPSDRSLSFERKKRCGGKCCSMPRKCWRSAPLLCVPYIKKSQEDVLKYLIKVMEKMIGKPLPPKRDIFEKTKFKPFLQKEIFSGCDNAPEEEIYECECEPEPAPSFSPEYLDLCPPPQSLFCPNPKSFSCPSYPSSPSYPPCSFTSSYSPYFPYPNSAKINPEFVKSFSYAYFNPPQLRQCPGLYSWPSDNPFYVPHVEQAEKQNPVHYEGKLATASPEATTLAPVSTTSATGVTETNITNSSQIVVSVPVYNNTSNSNVAKASFFPKSFASDSHSLPPQPASTTASKPTTWTNFDGVSPSPSTKSACALYVSNSPVGQEEHFSYTAVPYNGEPECSSVTNQNSETISPIPSDQPVIYNPVDSQKVHCDACFAKVENTSPNTQPLLEWPSTTNSLPTTETFHYQSQIKETPKSYKELYESSQEYPLRYNQFTKDDTSQKLDSSLDTKEDLEKSFHYNDNLQNKVQLQKVENPQKGFFRMKHKKKFKSKARPQPTEFLPPYDYYVYDKYPMMRPNDNNNMKLGRYPVPQLFWKDFGRKVKTVSNPKSLIRRKRKDYDFESADLDSYNDYFDDSNYNDEDSDKHPESYAKCFTKNYYNSEGTPPSYEMLSELAKIIREYNDTKSEFTTPISTAITVSTFDSTNQLTKSSLGKSSTNGASILQMTTSASNKTVGKLKNNNKRPFFQSNSKSANLPKAFASKTTFLPEIDDMSSTQISLTTATIDTKNNVKDRAIDLKKSGKTSFFQTNPKIIQTSKNSKKVSRKEEKEMESNKDSKTGEEGQIPTTLKTATIIKGQKKSLTKPSSKVYPKVYPDSFPPDIETNDTTSASAVTAVKAYTENRTALLSSTSKPDIKLQLLAVCEGYLEIVKLVKGQNQTTEGDLDADLARYCENIISQSFNNQLEKPKKPELVEFSPQNTNKGEETADSFSENAGKLNSALQTGYETPREFSETQLREKIIANILKDPVYTKKTAAKRNKTNEVTLNGNGHNKDDDNDDDDDDDDDDDEDDMDEDESENVDNNNNYNYITKKNEEESNFSELEKTDSTEVTEVDTTTEKDYDSLTETVTKKPRKSRRKEKNEKALSEKGLSKEEIKMLQILRQRKKALISWLFNLKNQDKLDDLDETEYFDDEDSVTETKTPKNSGTIKPKRGEKKSGRTKKNLLFDKESDFPIYAKRYGYDKGGELREVEVLWRKINKKTHEGKIFKNVSVLALFMTSPNMNHEDSKLVVNNGHENEVMSEVEVKNKNKIGYAAVDSAEYNEQTTASAIVESTKTLQSTSSSTTPPISTSSKLIGSNLTHTYISKPDSSSIVGECPKVKKAHSNKTRKTSRKMEVAKDLFQEYTIEFVNYAVYILPIMLTIIFLFCCLCCALHILKAQQSLKRHRKKKKKQFIMQETSDTTEESGLHSKKKKREVKFKKRSKQPESDAVSDKMKGKKFWSVLKLSSKPRNKLERENFQKSRKNTLLRFLKGAKEKERNDIDHRTDDRSDTADRKELIALLEEVKKIEMEHMDDTKDLKSVQVQYMTQEDDSSVFQRPDVFYPYQKNVFGMPKDYSFCNKPYPCQQTDPLTDEDCELYEDVNELTELLPCECTHFSKKNDCLRHCDFSINQQDPCKRFLKIFRDSGVCHNRPFNEKKFVRNESENRSFIFNKYRSINMDPSEELMGVTQKNAGTEIRLTDIASPFGLPSQKNSGILREIDNLKRQLNNKKNVRLKDDGVLCRL